LLTFLYTHKLSNKSVENPVIYEKIQYGGKNMTTILGIKLSERTKDALLFQEIITEHGCNIKTRIGLHQGTEDCCSNDGIILLELSGDNDKLVEILNKHWQIKSMTF